MKKQVSLVVALLAMMAISSTASALTLKEKKQYKEWQEYLVNKRSSYVKTAKDKFTTPFMAASANAASYCDEARSRISSMCEDATSKEAIKAKIKKIHCTLASKEEEASFKLAGGTLTFTFGVKASNLGDKVKDFLENNL